MASFGKVEFCLQLLLFSSKLLVYLHLPIFINFIHSYFSWKESISSRFSNSFSLYYNISSVKLLSHVRLLATPWTAACRLPCPSPTSRAWSNSHPSSQWCHPTISSSVIPFSSCLQTFPTLGSFPMSWLFASGGQSIRASASASVLPMNIQDWFPLELTGLISLLSKGLPRVFSNTTVQKHQFFGAQLSLWFNSHIHTWLLEKPQLWLDGPLLTKWCLCFLICYLSWS